MQSSILILKDNDSISFYIFIFLNPARDTHGYQKVKDEESEDEGDKQEDDYVKDKSYVPRLTKLAKAREGYSDVIFPCLVSLKFAEVAVLVVNNTLYLLLLVIPYRYVSMFNRRSVKFPL